MNAVRVAMTAWAMLFNPVPEVEPSCWLVSFDTEQGRVQWMGKATDVAQARSKALKIIRPEIELLGGYFYAEQLDHEEECH